MVTSAISWYWSSQPLILDKRERKKEEEEETKNGNKGDWMKTEKQNWPAGQDPTERWKIKYENEGELGGAVDQDPTSGAGRSRTMDRKCQIGQNWRKPRRKLTTARGGLQVDPQNKSGRDCLSRLTLKKAFRWTNQGKDTETIVLLDIPLLGLLEMQKCAFFPHGTIDFSEQTGCFCQKW